MYSRLTSHHSRLFNHAYIVYICSSEWLCLATCVWVNVMLQLPSVWQLWPYCTSLPVWIYVSLTYNYNKGRLARFSFLHWGALFVGRAYYRFAITRGICPPNLPNLQVLDEAESLIPAGDWLQEYAFRTAAFLRCPGSRSSVSELVTITKCFETTWVVQGSLVGITAPCTRLGQ